MTQEQADNLTREIEETAAEDASDDAAFTGEAPIPNDPTEDPELGACDHHMATLIKMDGVPRHDSGYACAHCGQRFVAMNSAGAFHALELVYDAPPVATMSKERHVPRRLRLDGLELKGVVSMRFDANLQGDARKVWIRLIVNSFDEIVEPL